MSLRELVEKGRVYAFWADQGLGLQTRGGPLTGEWPQLWLSLFPAQRVNLNPQETGPHGQALRPPARAGWGPREWISSGLPQTFPSTFLSHAYDQLLSLGPQVPKSGILSSGLCLHVAQTQVGALGLFEPGHSSSAFCDAVSSSLYHVPYPLKPSFL